MAIAVYIPLVVHNVFPFPHPHKYFFIPIVMIKAILTGVRCWLIVALIRISMETKDISIIFNMLLAICVTFENCLSRHVLIGHLVLFCN